MVEINNKQELCTICKKEYTSIHTEAAPGEKIHVCDNCLDAFFSIKGHTSTFLSPWYPPKSIKKRIAVPVCWGPSSIASLRS